MKRLALLILLIIPYISSAQIIHGNVSDSDSGEPLEMATIVLERDNMPINYVLTDAKGNYTLRIENIQKNDILSVTYMGYEKMNHNINNERIINFKLKPEARKNRAGARHAARIRAPVRKEGAAARHPLQRGGFRQRFSGQDSVDERDFAFVGDLEHRG